MSNSDHKDQDREATLIKLYVLVMVLIGSLVISVPLIVIGLSNVTYRNPGCPACESMGQFFGLIIAGVGFLFLLVSAVSTAGSLVMVRSLRAQRE